MASSVFVQNSDNNEQEVEGTEENTVVDSSLQEITQKPLPSSILELFLSVETLKNGAVKCEHVKNARTTAIFSKGAHRIAAAIGFQAAITMGSLFDENSTAEDDYAAATFSETYRSSGEPSPHTLFIRKQSFNELPPRLAGLPKPSVSVANGVKFVYVNSSDEFINLILALQSSSEVYQLIVVDNCTQALFSTWDEFRFVAITSLLSSLWSTMNERVKRAKDMSKTMPRCCYGMLLLPTFQKATQARSPLNLISHLFDEIFSLDQQQQTANETVADQTVSFYTLRDSEHDLAMEMILDHTLGEISTKIPVKNQ